MHPYLTSLNTANDSGANHTLVIVVKNQFHFLKILQYKLPPNVLEWSE